MGGGFRGNPFGNQFGGGRGGFGGGRGGGRGNFGGGRNPFQGGGLGGMFPGMGGGNFRGGRRGQPFRDMPRTQGPDNMPELQPFRGTMGPESIMPRNLSFGRFDR